MTNESEMLNLPLKAIVTATLSVIMPWIPLIEDLMGEPAGSTFLAEVGIILDK